MKFLIVTEAAFSDRMGHSFWSLVEQQGILKEECSLLPFLGHDKPRGKKGKVPLAQFNERLPLFRTQLEAQSATITICVGATAFRAVTGQTWKITSAAGYIMAKEHCQPIQGKSLQKIGEYKTTKKDQYKKGDPRYAMRPVSLPVIFPQGCKYVVPSIDIQHLRITQYKPVTQFRKAFENARRVHDGEPLLTLSSFKTSPPREHPSGVTSYDLEVPFGSTAIERASTSDENGTYTFEWDANAVLQLRDNLNAAHLRVAQNQQFDIPVLAAHGIKVKAPTFDTMLAAALIEPDLPKGLDAIAPIYLLLHPWKHLSKDRGFADPEYSALDAFNTRHLALAQMAELKNLGMTDLFNNRLMPAVPALMDMKKQGMKIDPKRTKVWCDSLGEELKPLYGKWVRKYPQVNPSSNTQLQDLLYKTLGMTTKRNKKDGITVDELALLMLKRESPEHSGDLDIILELRRINKLLGTYGRTALGIDRVHPSYLPVGKDADMDEETKRQTYGKGLAATGRLACSKPNLSNQPKEARIMYIPDSPDMCFMEFDWSQAELHVIAALSGDKAMQEALKTDYHAATMKIWGCDRVTGKAMTFSGLYGAGPTKQSRILLLEGIDVAAKECKDFQTTMAKAYPDRKAWSNQIADQAAAQKYLRNCFGRIRRFPLGQREIPAALNFDAQSTVGDMMWTILPLVHQAAKDLGGRLTTTVYDSLLLQVPSNRMDEANVKIRGYLEQPFNEVAPGFTIPADLKVGAPGASWGELK